MMLFNLMIHEYIVHSISGIPPVEYWVQLLTVYFPINATLL